MILFTPWDWYWLIGGNANQVYSSNAAAFVSPTDNRYIQWQRSNTPTVIESLDSLTAVLQALYPAGAPRASNFITPLAFLQRFTSDETTAIQTAALASPPTTLSLAIQNFLLNVSAATTIDLTSTLTTVPLSLLVTNGLLTQDRMTAIVTP